MTTKKFFDRASWVILAVLFIPAGLILASKNAVPGDAMYPVKLALEDAALVIIRPSYAATSDLQMFITKRRLDEIEQIVDTEYAVAGLDNLNEQVIETSSSIGQVKSEEKRVELATEYIQTLKETQASLEQQKINLNPANNTSIPSAPKRIAQNQPNSPAAQAPAAQAPAAQAPAAPAPAAQNQPNSPAAPAPAAQAPAAPVDKNEVVVAPSPEEVRKKIETTQRDIEEKIVELEVVARESKREQEVKDNHDREKKEKEEKEKENKKLEKEKNDQRDKERDKDKDKDKDRDENRDTRGHSDNRNDD